MGKWQNRGIKSKGKKQSLRIRRFAMAIATYCMAMLALFFVTKLGIGTLGPLKWTVIIGLCLAGNTLFLILLMTGHNRRFSDPSLTSEQIIFAAFWGMIQKVHPNFKSEVDIRWQAEKEKDRLIQDLQKAFGEIKTLSGLLPICANCKKIRDDKGYWNQIESYIRDHSEVDFSHSICPDCAKELYPDIVIDE